MEIYIFLSCAIFIGAICLWLGQRASQGLSSQEDYFLMGRRLGWGYLMMTLLATQLGGGLLLGAAEEAYRVGWLALLFPLGTCLGLLILATGYGSRLRSLNLVTISELFIVRYRSPGLRLIAGILSLSSLFFILVAQGIAARSFFAALGLSPMIFALLWLVILAYTTLGGLQAVVKTDMIQTVFILVALVSAFIAAMFSNMASDVPVWSAVSVPSPSVSWAGWLVMPLMFMCIEQDMAQRCFAAKSPRCVSRGAGLAAGILFLSALIPIYFGARLQVLGIEAADGQSVIVTAIRLLTPSWISGLFLCAILMVIISTADSILCAAASTIAYDFPQVLGKSTIGSSKVITCLLGIGSLVLSFYCTSVVGMLIFSYGLSVSCLSVPVIFGVFLPNPPRLAAWGSIVSGALGFCTSQYIPMPIPAELTPLLLSLLGYGFGAILSLKVSEGMVEVQL